MKKKRWGIFHKKPERTQRFLKSIESAQRRKKLRTIIGCLLP